MVCLVWLRDEALNALKRWSPEQLSDEKNDEEDEQYQTTRRLVYSFFYYLGKNQRCFGQNVSFHLNKMASFWVLRF
jgi:hypothetical protein